MRAAGRHTNATVCAMMWVWSFLTEVVPLAMLGLQVSCSCARASGALCSVDCRENPRAQCIWALAVVEPGLPDHGANVTMAQGGLLGTHARRGAIQQLVGKWVIAERHNMDGASGGRSSLCTPAP